MSESVNRVSQRGRQYRFWVIAATLGAMAVGGSLLVPADLFAQKPPAKPATPAPAAAAPAPAAPAPAAPAQSAQSAQAAMPAAPSAMTQAAAQAGVLTCSGRVDQISKFLATGNVVSFLFLLPPAPRDQRMASAAMEVDSPDVQAAYASAEFAASSQGCGASYETVTYWPAKCDDVFAKNYSKVRMAPPLGKSIAALDTGGNSRIFLMPAGPSGCITIKKELVN
jgi:hypothetical protein